MRLFVCAATCRGAEPLLEGTPFQFVVTPNLDTPYSGLPLDLSSGPMVVELPPGPPMGAANDLNQRWVMGLGYFNPTRIHVFTHLKPASTGSSSRTSSCTSRRRCSSSGWTASRSSRRAPRRRASASTMWSRS